MAAGFVDFIERAENLQINSGITKKYITFLENRVTPREKSRLSYCTMTIIFLEFLDKELKLLKIEDIAKFKAQKQKDLSGSRLNDILAQISRFISYCKSEALIIDIQEQDILNLRTPKKDVKEKNPPRIISPNEIMKIRQALIEKDDIRKLLTVELLYGFGLREKDLSNFSFENYNRREGTFFYERYKGKIIILPKYLQKVINNVSEKSLGKYSTYGGKEIETFKNHIIVAGELSGIKLKISDLTKTHIETSIKCYICGNTYPFEAQYWKLQAIGKKEFCSYFPICNRCGREMTEHE